MTYARENLSLTPRPDDTPRVLSLISETNKALSTLTQRIAELQGLVSGTTSLSSITTSSLTLSGSLSLPANSPLIYTLRLHNLPLPATSVLRIKTDNNRNIDGIASGSEGRLLFLINIGTFTLTINHENTGAVAANRIITHTALSVTIAASQYGLFYYDIAVSRWRLLISP